MVALAAVVCAASGCFLVAPSDEELLGGTASGGATGASVTGGSGTRASSASTGGSVGFCATHQGDPTVRFCEDFDDGAPLELATWTAIPDDAFATAELVTSPFTSSPYAARLAVLDGAPACHRAELVRQLIGTRDDPAGTPTRIDYGASFGVAGDGFVGAVDLEACTAIVTVHGDGTSVGLEFQWYEGSFMSAYVDYPVETTIVGRMPRVAFSLDLTSGDITFSVDGATLAPVAPLDIPPICRQAKQTTPFMIGVVCDGSRATVVDDVTFGTD